MQASRPQTAPQEAAPTPRPLVIYDLDRTITVAGTYTPFLLFAARRLAPHRLLMVPVAALAALVYKAGVISRARLKTVMLWLMLGSPKREVLMPCVQTFVDRLLARGCHGDALRHVRQARAGGALILLATASFDFYAEEIARRLGIDHVVATRTVWSTDGRLLPRIAGENCYGPAKRAMIEDYCESHQWHRAQIHVTFLSDHHSDAPVMRWADRMIAVNPSPRLTELAARHQWEIERWA